MDILPNFTNFLNFQEINPIAIFLILSIAITIISLAWIICDAVKAKWDRLEKISENFVRAVRVWRDANDRDEFLREQAAARTAASEDDTREQRRTSSRNWNEFLKNQMDAQRKKMK